MGLRRALLGRLHLSAFAYYIRSPQRSGFETWVGEVETNASDAVPDAGGSEKPPSPRPADTTDYRQRARVNLYAGIGVAVLVGIAVYSARIFYQYEKLENCIASHRRNCVDLDVPLRAPGVFVPAH